MQNGFVFPCSSNTKLNEASVTDAVVSLMDHVLSVNPSQPSWLRTQADLSYGKFSELHSFCFLAYPYGFRVAKSFRVKMKLLIAYTVLA